MFGGERKRRNKMVAKRGHATWRAKEACRRPERETEDVEEENDSDRNFKKRCFPKGRPQDRAA